LDFKINDYILLLEVEKNMKLITLNNKGQAFSTFQLLIAAVVALALLGVLMPIISKNINIAGSVVDATKEKIRSQQDQPGTLTLTDALRISGRRGETYIAVGTITDGTGMDPKQVRFLISDKYDSDFESNDTGAYLEIINQSTVTYKFGILCNSSLANLNSDITNYSSVFQTKLGFANYQLSDNDFLGDYVSNSKTCIVFPVKE
jgi:hypothetical protein